MFNLVKKGIIPFRIMLQKIGIDSALAWAGGARGIGMLFGPIGSLIVVWSLSPEEQGTYYLFLSLVALKALFDLGASAAIAQLVPHVMNDDDCNCKLPNPDFITVTIERMNQIAILFALIVGFGGLCYLKLTGAHDSITMFMWLATVLTTALTGAQEGRLKILYGAGEVKWTNKLRFKSQFIQYPGQWFLLYLGANLFSFSGSLLIVYLFQYYSMRSAYPDLWPSSKVDKARISKYKKDLNNLIRKSSITYASGILIFHIQQPIIYKYVGPSGSAKYGFTLTIASSLISLASLWGMTKFPNIAHTVASGEITAAFEKFKKNMWQTAFVATIGAALTIGALMFLQHIPKFSDRLIPTIESLPLLAAVWLQTVTMSLAYWPRSLKEEPFALVATIQMVASPVALLFLTKYYGLAGVCMGNLACWVIGAVGILSIVVGYIPGKNRCLVSQ